MTSLPSSRNLRAKARPIPAEPPVMRMVRPVSFIRVLSHLPVLLSQTLFSRCEIAFCPRVHDRITSVIQPMQKKSKAVQQVISYTGQHSFPGRRFAKDAGNGHRAHHRTENHVEISLFLGCGLSWHEL